MNRKKVLTWTFISSVLVAFLHLGALKYSWYWMFWWFDIPIHFLGGIVAALVSLFIYLKYGSVEDSITGKQIFWVTVGGAVFIGLLWEVYELVIGGRDFADAGFTQDTIADMLTDTTGGLLVYGIINRIHGRKS